MTQIQGGPAIPVSVVTGGKIKGGKAIPVYGYTSPPTDGRRAAAGPARPVYVVSDAQMAAGTFQLESGPALPMYVAPSGLSVVGDAAQPVYVVGGSLGGAPFSPSAYVDSSTRLHYAGIATFTTDNQLSGGGTAGTGRTFLSTHFNNRVLQAGYVRRVRVNVMQAGAANNWKFKIFRPNGTNWDFVSESETLTAGGTGTQTFNLSSPMACLPGDVLGVWLNGGAGANESDIYIKTRASTTGIYWLAGDNTGTNQNFTNSVNNFELCVEALGVQPFLATTGDSIAAGHHTAANWLSYEDGTGPSGTITSDIAYQLRSLYVPTLEYQNYGKGSQTASWVNSTGMVHAQLVTPKAIILHVGVNDINAGTTWASFSGSLDAIKAQLTAGQRLFVDEILPWTNGSDVQNGTIRTWNASLATWCASNSATLILCHDAMGKIRVSTGQLDDLATAYDYDGVHLTQAGVDKMAQLWYQALEAEY